MKRNNCLMCDVRDKERFSLFCKECNDKMKGVEENGCAKGDRIENNVNIGRSC